MENNRKLNYVLVSIEKVFYLDVLKVILFSTIFIFRFILTKASSYPLSRSCFKVNQ